MRMGAYVECNFLSIFFFQSTKAQQFRITDNEERAMADDKCFQTQTIRILKPQMKRMQLANSDTQEKTHTCSIELSTMTQPVILGKPTVTVWLTGRETEQIQKKKCGTTFATSNHHAPKYTTFFTNRLHKEAT